MECTQKLECTQDLYDTHTDRVCAEQIGFLGICGVKHPILRGPNKIGRDPQTCAIVLNLNSVSRQHAVINILSSKEFMLMDLDSANKTKHLNKFLRPYVPEPIRDGDTVQFGDIFGIFRIIEEDNELPMTQAIDLPLTQVLDIPETPVPSKQLSKLNKGPTTVIPESPDVSDKDESFSTPTQAKPDRTKFMTGQFIKSFGKSIPIHAISSQKDSSLNSTKRISSFIDSHNSSLRNTSTDKSTNSPVSCPAGKMSTNTSIDSIYMADTQIPPQNEPSPSIHSLDTQIPEQHVDKEQEMHAANKENNLSIFNADTQPFLCQTNCEISPQIKEADKHPKADRREPAVKTSDDALLFDEIEDECFEEFNSQPLLPQESPNKDVPKLSLVQCMSPASKTTIEDNDSDLILTQKVLELPNNNQQTNSLKINKCVASTRNNRIPSDRSTDDIEFMPTQIVQELPQVIKEKEESNSDLINGKHSDSSTDCEDIDMIPTEKTTKANEMDDLTDCEDDFLEINTENSKKKSNGLGMPEEISLEDMPTQVIDEDPEKIHRYALQNADTQIVVLNNKQSESIHDITFEDQPTQIVEEITPNSSKTIKVAPKDIISPFKVPLKSPMRTKSKEIPKDKCLLDKLIDDENYYNATQDILDDLCSQRDGPAFVQQSENTSKRSTTPIVNDDNVVPCSVENYEVGKKFVNIDKDLSPNKTYGDNNVKTYITNVSNQGGLVVVGVEKVSELKKYPSDSSDMEYTPKKVRTCMFTDSDLPNSEEIEISRLAVRQIKVQETEISSESEPEENTEDQYTPIVHKKKKSNSVAKIDLTKRFEIDKLPERIITRIRKPTIKMEENMTTDKKNFSNILKSKYLTEQEDQINEDLINENVKRLKTYEKVKSSKNVRNNKEVEEKAKQESVIKSKPETKEHVSVERRNNDTQEKIKVKIKRPKKKDIDTNSVVNEDKSTRKSDPNLSVLKKREKSPISNSKEARKRKGDTNNKMLQSNSEGNIKTRTTRSRKKQPDIELIPKTSVSPENNKDLSEENKRKRTDKSNEKLKESVSPEVEIRRSKRQIKRKDKNSDKEASKTAKAIMKKSNHDQSTVYNVSSSSSESPRNLKRPLEDKIDFPTSKRTRTLMNHETTNISNVSLRATPARTMKAQYVLFTAFPSEEVKQKLEKLGAVIVNDVMKCSVVLTMQIKRTFKLLCAVGLGKPIVGPSWVQACVDTHMIVDPWLYLIKDEQAEKRFQFTLERTLTGKRDFLRGFNISSTANVQPNGSEMKLIVECSGGTWKEGGANWVCVSCTRDKALWPALRKRGATVVSTEFILGGVLKQKLDINNNKFP